MFKNLHSAILFLFAGTLMWSVSSEFAESQITTWKELESQLDFTDSVATGLKIKEFLASETVENVEKARAMNSFARTCCSTGKVKEAGELVEKAKALVADSDDLVIQRSLWQIDGVIAAMNDELQRSIECSNKCIEISEKISPGDKYLVFPLNERGLVYQRMNRYSEAISDYQRAMKIADAAGYAPMKVKLYVNLGAVFNELNVHEKADENYRKGLRIAEQVGDVYSKLLILVNLGNNFLDQDDYKSGSKYYQQALELAEKYPRLPPNGQLYMGLGDVAAKSLDFVEAKKQYQNAKKAYAQMQDKTGVQTAKSKVAIAKFEIAKVEAQRNETDKKLVIEHHQDLDEQIKAVEAVLADLSLREDRNAIESAMCRLASLCSKRGEWRRATELMAKVLKSKQEGWDEVSRLSIETIAKREQDINELNLANQRLTYALFGGGSLALIGLIVWRLKRLSDRKLKQANASNRSEQQKNSLLHLQLLEKQKEEGLITMASGLLHDFNNYLATIVASAELGLQTNEPSKKNELLQTVLSSGISASGLTQRIYEYVGKGLPADEGVVSLSELVRTNEDSWACIAGPENKFAVSIDEDCFLPITEEQLDRVIVNLIKNSAEALEQPGFIRVSSELVRSDRNQAGVCKIVVEDNGSGMTSETCRLSSDPYFSTKGIGRGLGLAAVKGIVEGCEGKIGIESEVGKGTSVTIAFPTISKAEFEVQTAALDRLRTRRSTVGNVSLHGHFVLVEDDPILLNGLRKLLEFHNLKLTTFDQGKAAIDFFASTSEQVDILITDFALGDGVSGKEVASEARKRQPNCRTMLISGFAEDEVFESKLFDTFLSKPFMVEELRLALAELIKDARTEAA